MDREQRKRFRKIIFEVVFSLRHKQWNDFERAGLKFCKEFFRWRDIEWPREKAEKD